MNVLTNPTAVWPGISLGPVQPVGVVQELGPLTTAGSMTWVDAVRRALEQVLELKANWDNRRSGSVPPDTASFAFQLLTQTMPPSGRAPVIVPLGNGALQLEWHTATADLEVEVGKPNSVSVWYASHGSGEEQDFEITTDFRRLAGLIWSVANG